VVTRHKAWLDGGRFWLARRFCDLSGCLVLPRSLARRLCDLSRCFSLAGEGLGRQWPKAEMRPLGVVIDPPCFDPVPRIGEGQEPTGVKTLGSDAGVEGLDEGIIRGLPGSI
jgi:hypothetical protein